ncbi:hypothetical protein MN608_01028 [Microdochium nivale]|nr:hypothetical protein MN608_01028 [Microdochium nivale]
MLTTKQPVHYGYRAVNDLPTPPRTSPTLGHQDHSQNPASNYTANHGHQVQWMSGPHRGLPPPPGMAMPQPPPGLPAHQPPIPGPAPHPQALPPSAHSHPGMSLSSQPHPDEAGNLWYHAKVEEERRRQEEERRRQEEERTRQENLRLEQRKLEFDMLRTSLDRGIPPQLVPIIFAAMGGGPLPQAILEYAQSYIQGLPGHAMQSLPAPPATSPEHHRDQQYAAYAGSSGGVTSTPASSAGLQSGFHPYQGASSPPRQRAHTLSMGGPPTRPRANSNLSRMQTEEQAASAAPQGLPAYLRGPNPPPQATVPQTEQSPSIYFHHWQPPASQSQAAQPETPYEESPRKRKATGPPPPPPAPSSQIRARSPPFGHKSASARHRGHSRQRSDISSYRPSTRARGDSYTFRGMSPGLSTPRDNPGLEMGLQQQQQQQQPRGGAHSVNSLLSEQQSPRFVSADSRQQPRPQHQDRHFHSQQPIKTDQKDSPMSMDSSIAVGSSQREPH